MDVISDALVACKELATAIYKDSRTPKSVKDDLFVAATALNRAYAEMVIDSICRTDEGYCEIARKTTGEVE